MKRTQQLITSLFVMLCCCTGAWATGELNGLFTINASGDKVQFSQGNLQWSGTNGWRFASNQWDIIGSKANNTSPTSSNDNYMDLFCWGATGLNGVAPNTADSYLSGSSVLSGNNDWGTNMGASWRTLTSDEWAYLFNTRASGSTVNGTSNARYAFVTIRTDVNSGINGIILFPDGVNFAASEFTTLGTVNGVSSYATKCTSDQWTALEGKGCVFLPAAGLRSGSTVSYAGVHGSYWSSSPYASYEADKAYDVYFGNVLSLPRENRRFFGSSVRLVKDYTLQQDAEGYYLLGSADDWKLFAELVQTTPAANAKMTADIDLGTQITMIASDFDHPYQGTFDGQGHTLTVNWTTNGEDRIAPFRYAEGATIKRLHVDGSISKTDAYGRCPASILACSIGSATTTITECWSSVSLYAFDTIGGLFSIACGNSTTNIVDCVFSGMISASNSWGHSGGFVSHADKTYLYNTQGAPTVNVTRGLNLGTFTGGITEAYTFIRADANSVYGTHTVNSCYYKNVYGHAQGTQATTAELADGTITAALQNGRAEEVWVQDPVTNLPMLKIFANAAYTVPSSGIGTFSAKAKFAVPDGLTAHYCKTYDSEKGTISVVAIEGAVPANTGVLLKGTPGQTYTLTGTNDDAATVTDNALVAVTEATHVDPTSGLYTNFMMKSGKFIRIGESDESVKMSANRAYLQIQTSALPSDPTQARDIVLSWDEDEPTEISEVRGKKEDVRGEIYNLSGQRVSKPTKGLYIIGGKKVFIP